MDCAVCSILPRNPSVMYLAVGDCRAVAPEFVVVVRVHDCRHQAADVEVPDDGVRVGRWRARAERRVRRNSLPAHRILSVFNAF